MSEFITFVTAVFIISIIVFWSCKILKVLEKILIQLKKIKQHNKTIKGMM